MKLVKRLQETGQYISEAMARIFAPNNDSYPEIGEHPFKGEIHKKKTIKD